MGREREREKESTIYRSTYSCIHWLILACALTRDQTCNLGVLGRCSNQLSYPARVELAFKATYIYFSFLKKSVMPLKTVKATGQALLDTQSGCYSGSSLLPLDCDLQLHPPTVVPRFPEKEVKERVGSKAFPRWACPTGVGLPKATQLISKRQRTRTSGCELQRAGQLHAAGLPQAPSPPALQAPETPGHPPGRANL